MTIAAGFPCDDGLVICADTQETIRGYVKTNTDKTRMMLTQHFSVVFTGSGDADLLDMTIDEMDIALTKNKSCAVWDVRETLKKTLVSVFKNHILPDPHIGVEERPELLIALQYDAATLLFKACGTRFKQLHTPDSTGGGVVLAKSLTGQLFSSNMTLAQGAIAAIYILKQTKRWVDGCGGNTDVLLLSNRNRGFTRMPTKDVKDLEERLDNLDDFIRPLLLSAVDRTLTQAAYDSLIREFQVNMLGLRGSAMDLREFTRRLCELRGVPFATYEAAFDSALSEPNLSQSQKP